MILKTVTPAHVGTGNTYNNWEFVKSGDKLHRVNFSKFFSVLDEEKQEKLVEDLEKEKNLEIFLKEQKIDLHLLTEKYPEIVKYSVTCSFDNVNNIREQIKTNDAPYIPGSSIKGSIRGALIWYYTRTDENFQELVKTIDRDLRRRTKKKEIGNDYINKFFSLNNGRYDAKYDLMKFLEISDFMPENCKLAVKNVKTYSLRSTSLTPKHYDNFVESINGTFNGTIKVSPQVKEAVKNKKEYPLLEEKLCILGLNGGLNKEGMISHLKKVLREFNEWCLDKEIELCKKARNSSVFLKELDEIKSQNREKNLLRIGFGVGTIYQSLIKLIEEKDVGLAQKIINQYMLGKFKRGIDFKTKSNVYPPYPKSIEFTAENNEPVGWLGWED